jgi:hypothetical protein
MASPIGQVVDQLSEEPGLLDPRDHRIGVTGQRAVDEHAHVREKGGSCHPA